MKFISALSASRHDKGASFVSKMIISILTLSELVKALKRKRHFLTKNQPFLAFTYFIHECVCELKISFNTCHTYVNLKNIL